MCGIVGYVGRKKAASILVEGLKNLEYRGYDSAGIATISNNKIIIKKDIGKIEEVDKKVNFLELEGNIGIAHSRWSTHGKVTKENAHPHSCCSGKICIVHNGIIENYNEIKNKLLKKEHKFGSETDTEAIAHLIGSNYDGDIKNAVLKSLKNVKGSYALGIICSDEPDKLVAVRNESPLVIGVGEEENFIASDVPAIIKYTKKIIFPDDKEVAVLTKDSIKIYDLKGREIKKEIKEIEWSAEMAEKSGYKHFMLKEIFEQPRAIEETINGRIKNGTIRINEEIGLSDEEIKKISKIVIVACGTSWHAGLIGEFMIEELAKIPTEVEYASEFRYRDPILDKNTLVIAISQSGETADTLAALREAKKKGARIVSICNVVGSTITRESNGIIYTHAGPEIGVASTKAFISQITALYLITIYFGKINGAISEEQISNRIRDLRRLPLQMQSVLEDSKYAMKLAKRFYKKKNALYLGRGINFPIALEGALKLKEVSYIHAEGYPAAEMKHGPIALIDKKMPVFFIATKDNRTYNKILSNIQEVRTREGIVIAVMTKGDEEIKKIVDYRFHIEQTSYILGPLLAVIPFQLIAYYVAVLRGKDPDHPRSLAKSVTVE